MYICPRFAPFSICQWLLDHEIDPMCLDLSFSVEAESFGSTREFELKPDGARITVTDKNKVLLTVFCLSC